MLINYYFACLDVQDLLNNHNTQFSAMQHVIAWYQEL